MQQKYLSEPEAAKYLGMTHSALINQRWRGTAPPSIKIGRLVRYPLDAIQQWVDAQLALQADRRVNRGQS